MSKPDDDDRPNLNTGTDWSEMDLFDFANEIRLDRSIEFIADFLCRSRREVREKIAELERSGELRRLVVKTAARASQCQQHREQRNGARLRDPHGLPVAADLPRT